MIVSAVKMKNGRTYWYDEKKKLLALSWIVICVSMGLSIFSLIIFGNFLFYHETGLAGGLIVVLGYFFYNHVSKRTFWFGPPLVQESREIKPSPARLPSPVTGRKFCTNCGLKLEEESFKFCPDCGKHLSTK